MERRGKKNSKSQAQSSKKLQVPNLKTALGCAIKSTESSAKAGSWKDDQKVAGGETAGLAPYTRTRPGRGGRTSTRRVPGFLAPLQGAFAAWWMDRWFQPLCCGFHHRLPSRRPSGASLLHRQVWDWDLELEFQTPVCNQFVPNHLPCPISKNPRQPSG